MALTLTVVLTWLALKVFPKIGLMDKPHKYGLKRKPIPYAGGVIFYIVFLAVAVWFLPMSTALLGVIVGALILFVVNFVDDIRGLSPWPRLFAQIGAAVCVVLSGVRIESLTNPLGGMINLSGMEVTFGVGPYVFVVSLISLVVTVFWIMAMVNTMNWLDGLNGLPSGVTFIAAVVLFALAVRPDFHYIDQTHTVVLAAALMGMALGFLIFDFSPAKILMGDTGSMFFGYMLAVLAILSGGKVATAFLVMGLPILDFGWVILRRVWQGKSPFKGDLRHFHHRLVKAGFSERKSLFVVYAVCAAFGGTALFLGTGQKVVALAVLTGLVVLIGGWLVYNENT